MDYHKHMGRLKALHFISKQYKLSKDRVFDELKSRIRKVREKMEINDVRLVKVIYVGVQRKKVYSQYFKLVG